MHDRLGRSGLDQAALVHDGDGVTHMLDHAKIMGDEHKGDAEVCLQVQEQVQNLALR